ncbi:MAG TPA: type II secretion system F family protein [Planctomycetota bacterium]|nr:type II secretion system F family protein [Planctomycetota bacterium]
MAKKLQRRVVAPRPEPGTAVAAPAERAPWFGGRKVTPRVLSEFTSQLAVLLDAGIPVTKCLRILQGQMAPGVLKRTIGEVLEDVEAGTAFSESLAKHPRIFDRLYTNMVAAGEAGGVQEEILNRLSAFLERAENLKSRVRGALAYPIAIVIVAAIVLALVFVLVIPKFKSIFEQEFNTVDAMPWATRQVIGFGEHLQGWWWAYVLGVVLIVFTHRTLVARVPGYRRARDTLIMRLPVVGTLVNRAIIARFARTFGTLIQSGVPHLEALEIVRGAVPNMRVAEAVQRVHASIREGAGIAVPMGESGLFDDIVVNMVDVGEQTGELDRMLAKIADRYETEVDRTIETTFKALEPVMLVVLAVFVGFIVYALFAPMLKLMEKL